MSDVSISMVATIAVTFFVAGIVKGVTGMGLPTVAMAVLGSLISPLAAATLLIVPSFVTNAWQLFAGPSFSSILRRLWPMMLAIIAGTVLGSSFMASGDTVLTTAALGYALALYSLYTLFARQLSVPMKIERWMSPFIGAATGLITGVTGVFTLPAVPYLQALGLLKDDLIQALGLSFTISTIALAAGIGAQGAFQLDRMTLSVLAVIPSLAGMWAGQIIRDRIGAVAFRRGFLVLLFLLGAEMAIRPLF
ncbi:sulfite exporter TauE/SafE family protein [Sinorhizobium mexicanum]|uniref:Probable membrane transporter protein n=1 Tax=Sinorhizobium mexicanum TaxID=375549 RepID=A0A859QWS4_9HYPH|nr:sulfite exporter TauE/SafE family protein [Sinorhizobium mexicanum]MBP1886427.1 putative membrane protein YfcA [Sinorhizobium mexicanum]QLL63989.1 sulfite exporter TauE/SafE family protein [Sinorhizobium mexicanum]